MYGIPDSDIHTPFLQLCTETSYNLNAALGAANSEDTWFALVKDTVHYSFCDYLFTCHLEAMKTPRDEMEVRELITGFTRTFFDRHLLKKDKTIEDLLFDGVTVFKANKRQRPESTG